MKTKFFAKSFDAVLFYRACAVVESMRITIFQRIDIADVQHPLKNI
jgi:hypothetical protein